MLKKSLIFLGILLVILFIAGRFMSSASLDSTEYNQVKSYDFAFNPSDSTLTVMTYNIGYMSGMTNNRAVKREKQLFDSNLSESCRILSKVKAQIVGFQEIDLIANRSFNMHQLDSLAFAGSYPNAYESVNWDKNYVPFPYWPPSNHFGKILSGQAILSQFPISSGETIVLTPDTSTPFYYQAFYIDRLLQITKVEWLDQELVVMNVHLEAFSRETRVKQAQVVKEVFEKYANQQPVILMGDFNSLVPGIEEESDAIELLMESKVIASAIPLDQHDQNTTYSSVEPLRMIDYIFYNSNFLRCDTARVVREAGEISDHLPVWGRFELK